FDEYLIYFPLPEKIAKWIIIKWLNFFWNNAQAVISPSAEVAERMKYQGCKSDVVVIPTAIDEKLFENGDEELLRKELNLERRPLLYVGRIAYEKSLDFLLKVLHNLKDKGHNLPFVLIGDGPAKSDLQRQAERLGIRAYFLGWRKREELKDYYASAEAFIFASQTETQGLVVAEAESARLPVIAVKASGIVEAVPAEDNLLVDSMDVEVFAQNILHILQDKPFKDDLIRRGREHVKAHFSINGVTDKVISLYKTLKKG
ncbi:glycosyltransferase, partial [bacterium]|nr:glycosyltransferase [bacterium]